MRNWDEKSRLRRRVARAATASALVAGAAAALGSPATAAPEDAAPEGIHYVALGDSFAAGAGVLPELDFSTCLQSELNYPKLVARQLHVTSFRDVTCGGATLGDLYGREQALLSGPSQDPQVNALTPDTTLITLTMGGNDIGLAKQAMVCFNALPEPYGHSCAADLTADGRDVMADRLAALTPRYNHALDDLHARAPRATIVVVGYPTVAPPGGCPQQPSWPADVDYLRHTLDSLNEMLRTAATTHGARFVDTASPSVGHDMCAAPDQQWVNGLIPSLNTPAVVPLHPNAAGEQQMATEVLAALQ